jgi:hypothetical protein
MTCDDFLALTGQHATRNTRLAAIHSLFRYASLRAPEQAELIARVLAIQTKRTSTTIVTFLDPSNSTRC